MEKTKEIRTNRGITLIALVITIIVLLILAGVSIRLVVGDNGIIIKASNAKIKTVHASVKDAMILKELNYEADEVEKENKESFSEYLKKELIIQDAGEEIYNINVTNLLGQKQSLGNGTGKKDVYKLEKTKDKENYIVNYYDKDEAKTEIIEINFEKIKENNKKPEQMEPTEIYAKVYSDGVTIFSSFDYVDNSHGDVERAFTTDELNYSESKGEPPAWLNVTASGSIGEVAFRNVIIYDKIAPVSTSYWFAKTESIQGIENLITNNVTNMEGMFTQCRLKELDLSNFDTSSVTTMRIMFSNSGYSDQTNIKYLDLSSFDTRMVKNMAMMFLYTSSLETLDISGFEINEMTKLSEDEVGMFDGCAGLKTVYVKNEKVKELLEPYINKENTRIIVK